jgi:hypothetical protein
MSLNEKISNKSVLKKLYRIIYYVIIKRHFYGITSSLRILPDFIIIGSMRSGTTSLNFDLPQHPCIGAPAYDEIGFFDSNFELGLNWYRSMFPSIFTKYWTIFRKKYFLTGEDTPFYFWNPVAAKRIFETLPNVKLIILLRNPIDRAYSHYNNAVRIGVEKFPFEEQIKKELDSLKSSNEANYERFVKQPSYLAVGIYADQLQIWTKLFKWEQLLIISTEDLEKTPIQTLNSVFKFLNLPEYEVKNPEKRKAAKYDKMNPKTREMLIEYFRPHNEKLYKMIGKRFDWDK